ncbi:hypothetical protein [Corynebacterium mastitidis]
MAKIQETYGAAQEVPFAGRQRDAAINILKQLKKAYDAGDTERVVEINAALQLVLTSSMARADIGLYSFGSHRLEAIRKALRDYGGYELTADLAGRRILREIKGAQIPKADPSEYITVVVPDKYDISKGAKNPAQRIVPIDQPGLGTPPSRAPRSPRLPRSRGPR